MPAGNDPSDLRAQADQILTQIRAEKLDAITPPRFRTAITLPAQVGQALADTTTPSLYLTGPVGAGKTHAAWAVIRRILEHDDLTHLATALVAHRATTLLDLLRPSDDPTAARREVTRCQHARLLFLDDLGAEKPTEWTRERLYEIVDHRYAELLPVVVTSNLPPSKLGDHVGERVASRLAEMCTVVPLIIADRRRPR